MSNTPKVFYWLLHFPLNFFLYIYFHSLSSKSTHSVLSRFPRKSSLQQSTCLLKIIQPIPRVSRLSVNFFPCLFAIVILVLAFILFQQTRNTSIPPTVAIRLTAPFIRSILSISLKSSSSNLCPFFTQRHFTRPFQPLLFNELNFHLIQHRVQPHYQRPIVSSSGHCLLHL